MNFIFEVLLVVTLAAALAQIIAICMVIKHGKDD